MGHTRYHSTKQQSPGSMPMQYTASLHGLAGFSYWDCWIPFSDRFRRKLNTKVWLKVTPPRGDVRWTKRVVRAASSAMVVKISRMAWATCGIVVIGETSFKGIMLCVGTTFGTTQGIVPVHQGKAGTEHPFMKLPHLAKTGSCELHACCISTLRTSPDGGSDGERGVLERPRVLKEPPDERPETTTTFH